MANEAWAELVIRLGVGAVMVAFGSHQLLRPENWREYIPHWLGSLLPTSAATFMRSHGFGNLALGVMLALGLWIEVTAWIVLIWWLTILPFAFYVNWRNGFRDLAIICALIALVLLAYR